MNVEAIIDRVIEAEGSAYTNDPRDSGGPTKYGITLSALSSFLGRPASAADVQNLDEQAAREIYRRKYVIDPGFLPVVRLYSEVGAELVDTGVNVGTARAVMFLQRALNALNNGGKLYSDVRVDGEFGPGTRAAFNAYVAHRGTQGAKVLLAALNALQGEYYIDLAERRPKDEAFVYGWLLNRVAS